MIVNTEGCCVTGKLVIIEWSEAQLIHQTSYICEYNLSQVYNVYIIRYLGNKHPMSRLPKVPCICVRVYILVLEVDMGLVLAG